MIPFNELLGFSTAALVLLLIPGPAVAFVIARSVECGPVCGVISQLGMCTGLLFHVIAISAGLWIVFPDTEGAFWLLQSLGAAYLIGLGIRAMLTPVRYGSADRSGLPRLARGRMFLDGLIIDTFNPKPALFLLAFLPQFIDPSAGDPSHQSAWLGMVFVLLALGTGSAYAFAAGALSERLARSSRLRHLSRYLVAATYLTLGLLAALWKG